MNVVYLVSSSVDSIFFVYIKFAWVSAYTGPQTIQTQSMHGYLIFRAHNARPPGQMCVASVICIYKRNGMSSENVG